MTSFGQTDFTNELYRSCRKTRSQVA